MFEAGGGYSPVKLPRNGTSKNMEFRASLVGLVGYYDLLFDSVSISFQKVDPSQG